MIFAAGISGLRLPASQSLHALSMGQTPPPTSIQHLSSGARSSYHSQKGPSAVMQVSSDASTPVVAQGSPTVMHSVFVPVSGHQVGGTARSTAPAGLGSSGPSTGTLPSKQLVAQTSGSGGGSVLGTSPSRQFANTGTAKLKMHVNVPLYS